MVLFFWIVVSNIPRLLSSISRLLLARFGQDMDKPLATDVLKTKVKISLFTILFTITVHSEFLPI